MARPKDAEVRALSGAPFWLNTDSAAAPQDLVVEWIGDDGVDVFTLPEPVTATLYDEADVETPLTVAVTDNVAAVTVPTLPVGHYAIAVRIAGDQLFAVADLEVHKPNPSLPWAPWQTFSIVGPSWYPGWGPEGGSGGGGAGPTGPTGPTGPAGADGATGPTGPAGEGGGGAVDWANVPEVVNVTLPASGAVYRSTRQGSAYPTVEIYDGLGVVTFKTGAGGTGPVSALTLYTARVNPKLDVRMETGKAIKFFAAAQDDTVLMAGATAGELTINGKAIQHAAVAADGTEVSTQDLHDEIQSLKAELRTLRDALADLLDNPSS